MDASATRKGTLLSALEWGANELKKSGKLSPRLDAEIILSNLLAIERIRLYIEFESPIAATDSREFMSRIRRRAAGEPVAYITAQKEFYSRAFEVNPHVLIPRPETECVVKAVLDAFSSPEVGTSQKILDLCTGSGCIAITIAMELPGASVTAVDISEDALKLAVKNAAGICPDRTIEFLQGDLFDPVGGRMFDAIVSNPPYIPAGMISELQDEIRLFEPGLALDGGVDGLDIIDRITQEAHLHLVPGGRLFVEIGEWECNDAIALFEKTGRYHNVHAQNDLSDRPRIITAIFEG